MKHNPKHHAKRLGQIPFATKAKAVVEDHHGGGWFSHWSGIFEDLQPARPSCFPSFNSQITISIAPAIMLTTMVDKHTQAAEKEDRI
jgi:hypothetical protein